MKMKDAKYAVTYQSWRWDLTVYWHVGCKDCTLSPHAIRSLQGYPGKLVWNSSDMASHTELMGCCNKMIRCS